MVPDHTFHIRCRCVRKVRCEISRRCRDWKEQLRDRPGRRRACCDRDGNGGLLERGSSFYRDERPRRQPDERVSWSRIFCRGAHGFDRCPAHGPVDRDADSNTAVRHPACRLCFAWRHEASAAVPRFTERVLRDDGSRIRPYRAIADTRDRDDRSRPRHERPRDPTADVG